MRTRILLPCLAAAAALGACKEVPENAPEAPPAQVAMPAEPAAPVAPADPATAEHRFASWAGKWTGVEGMYLVITPGEPGQYKLEMQSDLDTKGTYDGRESGAVIRFTRGTETLALRAGTGDATGLKYLTGKTDCLIVKSGEGYCR